MVLKAFDRFHYLAQVGVDVLLIPLAVVKQCVANLLDGFGVVISPFTVLKSVVAKFCGSIQQTKLIIDGLCL